MYLILKEDNDEEHVGSIMSNARLLIAVADREVVLFDTVEEAEKRITEMVEAGIADQEIFTIVSVVKRIAVETKVDVQRSMKVVG